LFAPKFYGMLASTRDLENTMQKKLIGAALAAALGTLMTGTAMAADVTLRISLQLPLKSHLGQNLVMFEEEVEKSSGGAIEVEIYDSAQLYKDKEVPAAVGSGALEMGVASLTRYVGDVPAVDIFYQPFLFDTAEKVNAAVAKGSPVRGPIDEAIQGTGSTVLWWQAYGGAIMLSKGGAIKTPDDMQGKKVRVFGKTLGDFVTATGGAPTLISGSEQYLAYQRGTVDIGMTGVSGVKSRKLWEVMDTITVTNHADIEFVVVVNTEFWNSLSDEHKAIIETAAANAEADVRSRVSEIEADAYAAAKEQGMSVYEPGEEDLDAWKAASQPVYDAYKANAGELGAQLLEAAQGL
jgi:C4-dicarboxylate-binding protein DctP